MGIVISGGLLFSLGLTLFIIPALYTNLSTEKKKVGIPAPEVVEAELT